MRDYRKGMPIGGERLIWAQGDGSSLRVFNTEIGRMAALICRENVMPLAHPALYNPGAPLHLSSTRDSSKSWLIKIRHIAKGGWMCVASSCNAMHMRDIPDE